MPMYDYKCLDCGKEFLLALTLKEHESGAAACSSCGAVLVSVGVGEVEDCGYVARAKLTYAQ